jgi:hypothetical protein
MNGLNPKKSEDGFHHRMNMMTFGEGGGPMWRDEIVAKAHQQIDAETEAEKKTTGNL